MPSTETPLPQPPLGATARRGPTVETLLYLLILLLAIASRFALLDSQAMHHDEGIHALGGWNIYQGTGYVHNAVYHGPFIYHAGALSFALFGDSDITARLPGVLFGIGTVMLPVLLRRYIGRWGALLASFLLLISPTFLYFARFDRNDVFGGFWTLLLFVCVVRYLGERRDGWLYGAVLASCLHFCAKETAYITAAIFLLFLGGRVIWQRFGLPSLLLLFGLLPAGLEDFWRTVTNRPFPLRSLAIGPLSMSVLGWIPLLLSVLGAFGLLAWCWVEGCRTRRTSPTLDLAVALGTTVLPLLSAVPLDLLLRLRRLPPIDYESGAVVPSYAVTLGLVAIGGMFALSALIGLWWDARRWLVVAGLFWGIFFLLHTSFFGSMTGWATGLVQALGFWMSQQTEKRIHVGPQYYLFLIPVYETVSFLFGGLGMVAHLWRELASPVCRAQPQGPGEWDPPASPLGAPRGPAMGLLAWWAPLGLIVYSLAGEQVPWLNVHPTLPFLLLAAAWMGQVAAWKSGRLSSHRRRLAADILLLVGFAGWLAWAGRPLVQEAWSTVWEIGGAPARAQVVLLAAYAVTVLLFLGGLWAVRSLVCGQGEGLFLAMGGAVALCVGILGSVLSHQQGTRLWAWLYVPIALLAALTVARALLLGRTALRSALLLLFGVLCLCSLSAAWRLTYILNDTPVEMLVYVQTSSDVQWAMEELGVLSTLTTGGKEMPFLYDSEVAWPLEWYFRNYTQKWYKPTIAPPFERPVEEAVMAFVYRSYGEREDSAKAYLEGKFVAFRYYAFNWWFPEEVMRSPRSFLQWAAPQILPAHRQATWWDVLRALGTASGQMKVWRYYFFREPPAPLGAREFAVYVRKDLAAPLEWVSDALPRR
ncbi:MAG: flippase activity-associated protein Agl23 [Chloroflexia bacterium]